MTAGRALVTGVGVHSGLGDEHELRAALTRGASALRVHTLPEADGFPPFAAAPAAPGSPARFLADRKLQKYMSEVSRLATLAAGRALEAARLLEAPPLRGAMALFLATGPMAFDLDAVRPSLESCVSADGTVANELLGEGLRRCHPLMPFKLLLNMPLGLTSIVFGIRGENGLYYPGASQAGLAFEAALRGLAAGRFERALVGAAVHGVSLLPVASLARLGRLAPSLERFAEGEGLAPADASAFLVLESEASAADRGVQPICTLEGAASGLALAGDLAARAGEEVSIWARACGRTPRGLLASATGSPAEDAARVQAVEARWPGLRPRGLDPALGSPGAAGLALHAAFAALELAAGSARGPLLVADADLDGGAAAVVLS
jgi:3-oxoacyl-(acyl-carrier-protein) synthase